jgi:hypothetical protein
MEFFNVPTCTKENIGRYAQVCPTVKDFPLFPLFLPVLHPLEGEESPPSPHLPIYAYLILAHPTSTTITLPIHRFYLQIRLSSTLSQCSFQMSLACRIVL